MSTVHSQSNLKYYQGEEALKITLIFPALLTGSAPVLSAGLPVAGALPGRGPGPVLRSTNIPLQSLSQHRLPLRLGLLLCRQTGCSSTHWISGKTD